MSDIDHIVQLRGGFSDRNNYQTINAELQVECLDIRTRTAICNLLRDFCKWLYNNSLGSHMDFYKSILENVYCEYINDRMIDTIRYSEEYVFDEYIKKTIFNDTHYNSLTLIEYIINWYFDRSKNYWSDFVMSPYGNFEERINRLFEQEYVGYRFIGNHIARITDTEELTAIEETLSSSFSGCKSHISKAVGFLSDRDHPDYKNSVKESISAVESVCKIIVGKDSATLGDALKILESKNGLKGQLKSGFEKLYNYTNDKGGIRHAEGLFESNVSFEEAKYMLVSCCAFVNYLIAEYGKTK